MTTNPTWGLAGMALFLASAITGAFGAVTGWTWGHLVTALQRGEQPWRLAVALVVSLLVSPLLLSQAFWVYPRWWVSVQLGVRTAVLHGQTAQRRLVRTPPGEAVARAMDADRITRYADRWVDLLNGLAIVVITSVIAGTWLAGAILLVGHGVGRAGLVAGPPYRRPLGGGVLDRPGPLRTLAGLGARLGADDQARGRHARHPRPPRARSTADGSRRPSASTGSRRCSTACPSSWCSAASSQRGAVW